MSILKFSGAVLVHSYVGINRERSLKTCLVSCLAGSEVMSRNLAAVFIIKAIKIELIRERHNLV